MPSERPLASVFPAGFTPINVSIGATFALDSLDDALSTFLNFTGLPVTFSWVPYGTPLSCVLSEVAGAALRIILVRVTDLQGHPEERRQVLTKKFQVASLPQGTNLSLLLQCFEKLLNVLKAATSTPIVLLMMPLPPAEVGLPERALTLRTMEHDFLVQARSCCRSLALALSSDEVAVLLTSPLSSSVPRCSNVSALNQGDIPYSAEGDALAHAPFPFLLPLAPLISRQIYRRACIGRKLVILDCDNTLWGGAVGELGPKGVVLSSEFLDLQRFFVDLHDKGFLLCLCSRNIEEDVLSVFAERDDMVLKLTHIIGLRVNWQTKSVNVSQLVQELGLGLESVVFVDDNPLECMQVLSACPGVVAIHLPPLEDLKCTREMSAIAEIPHSSSTKIDNEPSDSKDSQPGLAKSGVSDGGRYLRFLREIWAFDLPMSSKATDEDADRTTLYRGMISRNNTRNAFPTFSAFMASLNLWIDFAEMSASTIDRVSQLTERTNQHNSCKRVRSPSELQDLSRSHFIFTATSGDRFCTHGLVGVFMAQRTYTHVLLEEQALRGSDDEGLLGHTALASASTSDGSDAVFWDKATGPILVPSETAPVPSHSGQWIAKCVWVPSLMLSCRALHLGIEHAMVRYIAELAGQAGADFLAFSWNPSARNEPSRAFLFGLASNPLSGCVFVPACPRPETLTSSSSSSAFETKDQSPAASLIPTDPSLATISTVQFLSNPNGIVRPPSCTEEVWQSLSKKQKKKLHKQAVVSQGGIKPKRRNQEKLATRTTSATSTITTTANVVTTTATSPPTHHNTSDITTDTASDTTATASSTPTTTSSESSGVVIHLPDTPGPSLASTTQLSTGPQISRYKHASSVKPPCGILFVPLSLAQNCSLTFDAIAPPSSSEVPASSSPSNLLAPDTQHDAWVSGSSYSLHSTTFCSLARNLTTQNIQTILDQDLQKRERSALELTLGGLLAREESDEPTAPETVEQWRSRYMGRQKMRFEMRKLLQTNNPDSHYRDVELSFHYGEDPLE